MQFQETVGLAENVCYFVIEKFNVFFMYIWANALRRSSVVVEQTLWQQKFAAEWLCTGMWLRLHNFSGWQKPVSYCHCHIGFAVSFLLTALPIVAQNVNCESSNCCNFTKFLPIFTYFSLLSWINFKFICCNFV